MQIYPSLITLHIVYAILILLAGLLQGIVPSRFFHWLYSSYTQFDFVFISLE